MIIPQELRGKIEEMIRAGWWRHGYDGYGCTCCNLLEKLWLIVEVEENS